MMTKKKIRSELEKWIEEQRLQEYTRKTLIDYKNAINKFINFIDEESFEISKDLTMKYKGYLLDNYATSSRNKYIVVLNKFLKYLDYKECTLKQFKTQQKTSIDDPIWEQEHKRMLRWAKKMGMDDMYLIL